MSFLEDLESLRIPFPDIEEATKNFTTVIGKGGYGLVYKGELLLSGKLTSVAVKRLDGNVSGQGFKEFLTEIQLLTRYKHPNLISLIGFCDQDDEKILIYEHAEHGSLDKYLSTAENRSKLTWKRRINICVNAANGLNYLHNEVATNERVVHRDIKSANVLLDRNWKAMISDLGLSKLGRANEKDTFLITNAVGTLGYCDPVYISSGILTKESDVYSFGVVLFEVLCGRLCFIDVNNEHRFLPPLAQRYSKIGKIEEIMDPELKNQIDSDSLIKFSEIALQCLQNDRKRRPSMRTVLKKLEELEKALELQHSHTCTIQTPTLQMDANKKSGYPKQAKEVALPKNSKQASVVFLNQLKEGNVAPIKVMVCRTWDVNNIHGKYLSTDYVLSDEQGNIIHCTAKNSIAHCFINKLQEGYVYVLRNFNVLPNKDEYRIMKDAAYMIELQGSTSVSKATTKSDGFIRYPFQFTEFEKLEPTEKKYLVDVIGYTTTVGGPVPKKTGSKTLDFNFTNQRGRKIKVTLWGSLADDLLQERPDGHEAYAMILTSMSAKYCNNQLCLSSTSSTLILDDDKIPALKEFKSEISDVDLAEETLPIVQVQPKDGTIKELLQWGRAKKNDVASFRIRVEITNIRTIDGWYYFSCTSGKCKKGVSRRNGNFWCESCDKGVNFPMPRFRLQINVEDESAETVILMYDGTVEKLVNVTAKSLIENTTEDMEDPVLPHALTNLINTTHIMEIQSHTYYQHGDFERFTCNKIVQDHITINEGTAAATEFSTPLADESLDDAGPIEKSPLKNLKRGPGISTPTKAYESTCQYSIVQTLVNSFVVVVSTL